MKKVYQTTAGKKTIYIVISAISHLETEDNIDNKKFPYSLDIHYIGKEVSGIIYSDKKERDKVVDDFFDLYMCVCPYRINRKFLPMSKNYRNLVLG